MVYENILIEPINIQFSVFFYPLPLISENVKIIQMDNSPQMNLDLRSPLVYARIEAMPGEIVENEEFLLCFNLDPAQSRSIEPKPELLLGSHVFTGRKSGDSDNLQSETVSLPAGNYLFMQVRGALSREEWLDLAVEQQKDGLWERYKLQNRLYVRFLFEDGNFVTQLFRLLETG